MPARPPPAWVLATTELKIRVGVCLAGEVPSTWCFTGGRGSHLCCRRTDGLVYYRRLGAEATFTMYGRGSNTSVECSTL